MKSPKLPPERSSAGSFNMTIKKRTKEFILSVLWLDKAMHNLIILADHHQINHLGIPSNNDPDTVGAETHVRSPFPSPKHLVTYLGDIRSRNVRLQDSTNTNIIRADDIHKLGLVILIVQTPHIPGHNFQIH
jgi:hypothetical protein